MIPFFFLVTFDESLDDLHRIARYCTSSIALQRLVHVKLMAEVSSSEGYSATSEFILPLLKELTSDEEMLVRQHTAEQLKGIGETCAKRGGIAGYSSFLEIILPTVAKLVADSESDVRNAACETLVSLAAYVKPEDLGAHVLTIVLTLAHDEEHEDLRMVAVCI
jgi:serine/threonine-protein phosphatase 4 regulatory subunit 1